MVICSCLYSTKVLTVHLKMFQTNCFVLIIQKARTVFKSKNRFLSLQLFQNIWIPYIGIGVQNILSETFASALCTIIYEGTFYEMELLIVWIN